MVLKYCIAVGSYCYNLYIKNMRPPQEGTHFNPIVSSSEDGGGGSKRPKNQMNVHRINVEKIKAHRAQRIWCFLSNRAILWPFQMLPYQTYSCTFAGRTATVVSGVQDQRPPVIVPTVHLPQIYACCALLTQH